MARGKPKALIGPIPTIFEIAKFAQLLQPSYKREHWTWRPGAERAYVPTARQIQETIERLANQVGAAQFTYAATGGIEVRFEQGQKMLYVSSKLQIEREAA